MRSGGTVFPYAQRMLHLSIMRVISSYSAQHRYNPGSATRAKIVPVGFLAVLRQKLARNGESPSGHDLTPLLCSLNRGFEGKVRGQACTDE